MIFLHFFLKLVNFGRFFVNFSIFFCILGKIGTFSKPDQILHFHPTKKFLSKKTFHSFPKYHPSFKKMHPNTPSATPSIIQNTSYRFFFVSTPIKFRYFFKNISWNKFKIIVEHPFFTKTTFETLLTAPLATNISKH